MYLPTTLIALTFILAILASPTPLRRQDEREFWMTYRKAGYSGGRDGNGTLHYYEYFKIIDVQGNNSTSDCLTTFWGTEGAPTATNPAICEDPNWSWYYTNGQPAWIGEFLTILHKTPEATYYVNNITVDRNSVAPIPMTGVCAASGCCCASWFPNYSGNSNDNETYPVEPYVLKPVLVKGEGFRESGWNH